MTLPDIDSPQAEIWTDDGSSVAPADDSAFTPERVQSILESRGHHAASFLSLVYSDPAQLHRGIISKNLQSFQTQVLRHRALTDDEAGALTDHWSSSANIALTAKPAVVALSLFLAWRGRARFRFPFWQPKWEATSPDVFPSLSQPLVSGKGARVMWHASRLLAYGALCNWLVTPLFLSYAGVRATVGISSDPRLQDTIKESVRDIQSQRKINHLQRRSGKMPTEFPPEGQAGPAPEAGQTSQAVGRISTPEDWRAQDATPQSPESQAITVGKWDPPLQGSTVRAESSQSHRAPHPSRQQPLAPLDTPSPAWGDDSLLDEIDDASPVAAPERAPQTQRGPKGPVRRQTAAQSDDGLSAWERLREQAQSDLDESAKR